jgi:hypothetical protein
LKVKGAAEQLAVEFDSVLAEVIDVAESCDDQLWRRRSLAEERTVGVLFDHIAAGNDQAVEWATSFLRDRDVEVDPGLLDSENAAHAREVRSRPRQVTIARIHASSEAASRFLHRLTDSQLGITQRFGWLGSQDLAFVIREACRHPQRHLQSIREALQG